MADTNDTASAFDALINQVQSTASAEKPKEKEESPSEPPHADDISSEFDKLITNVQAPVATGDENTPTVGQTLGAIPIQDINSGHMDVARSIEDPEGIKDLSENAKHIPLTQKQIDIKFKAEHPEVTAPDYSGSASMLGYGALPAPGSLSALTPPAPSPAAPSTPTTLGGIATDTYHLLQAPGKMVASFVVPAAKAVKKAATDVYDYGSLPAAPNQYDKTFTKDYSESPEITAKREAARQKVGKDVQDIASAFPQAAREIVDAAAKPMVGGSDVWDKFLYDRGLRSYDQWKHNYSLRHDYDHIGAVQEAMHPNEWAQWLNNAPEWMIDKPLAALVKSTMVSPEDLQKNNPGMTHEQAVQQVNNQAMQIARDSHRQMIEDQDRVGPTDKGLQMIGGFLPMGNIFSIAGEGMGAARAGVSKVSDLYKYPGMSAEEINAAKTAAKLEDVAAKTAGKSEMPVWGQGAINIANFLDKSEEWVKNKLANIPAPVRPLAEKVLPPLATMTGTGTIGAAVGAYKNPEDRFKGALEGATTAELMRYAPRVLADIARGGTLSAGGKMGRFEAAAKSPESSVATRLLLKANPALSPKFYDYLGNNLVKGIANMGVETIPLTLALGAVRSDSPEEQANTLAQGLFFSGGHKLFSYALGKNASSIARERAQDHADIVKQHEKMDPEDRENAKALGSWDAITQKSQKELTDAQDEHAQALAENGAGSAHEIFARENLDLAKKKHEANTKASPETRMEYYRLMQKGLVDGDRLINGSLRSGQNLRIALRTTDQLKQMILQNNPQVSPDGILKLNPSLTPEQAKAISDQKLNDYTQQYGSRWKRKGGTEPTLGKFTADDGNEVVLDPSKQTVVVNMDNVYNHAMMTGKPFYQTFYHELGHAMQDIPEFNEANKEASNTLFGDEIKDLNGNVVGGKPGALSNKDLVKMFTKEYLGKRGGYNQDEIVQFAKANGLWDDSRQSLDENAVADYMKNEVLADLNSNGLHMGLDKTLGMKQGMVDWARLQAKNSAVGRAVTNVIGFGQEHPFTGAATGYTFSPEVLAANRKAIRALADLNGEVSPSISAPETPAITKAGILRDKGLLDRYGKDSGLVKTQMRGVITDAQGKVIKTVDITNPMAAEGTWQANLDGSARQTSGYGQLPDELTGTEIPQGGAIRVENQVVMQPDGVTPVLNSKKEAKALLKQRADMIRNALDNTDDVGAPGRFRSVSADGLTYRGTFTPLQIKAIQELPETIIPRSLKETILKLNEQLAKGDGSRIFVDYAPRMDANGNYKSVSPKIYDLVPISMHFSKDGNFLATTISVGRMFDKLNLWSQRMPTRLSYWGGDRDAFLNEFINKYLKNWQEGKPGETGLDEDPKVAIEKRNIFNDFLNLSVADANPDVTTVPRAKGSRSRKKEDNDRTIMSVRADAITGILDHAAGTKVPVDYFKAKYNLMPAKTIEREIGTNEEFTSKPEDKDAIEALDKSQQVKYGLARNLEPGYPVALRIDISAFNRTGKYVVTVHEKGTPGSVGTVIGYDNIARVDNPKFSVKSNVEKIKEGSAKFPVATVNGDFNPSREIPADINEWTPVGFDPKEHSFFYDKATDDVVTGGDEAISVGNTVFVKNPTYGDRSQVAYMPKKITSATYTDPKTGEVTEGETHREANPNAPQEATDRESPAYGFKTSSGDIVDRATAYQIAKDAGQLKTPTTEEEKFHADRGILHSGMYDPKGNINFMPAKKLDEAHAKAIESGDMEEAQRLVDEKAKQKGGILVFHGTTSESGDINVPVGAIGSAHVTTSIEEADYFAGLKKDYLNEDLGKNAEKVIKNWYLFGDVFDPTNKDHIERAKKAISLYKEIAYDPEDDVYNPEEWQHHAYDFFEKNSEVRNAIKKSGFVGYKDRENSGDSYPWSKSPNIAVFDPNNIKSADPATYDKEGKLIPLSQRFDTTKSDIRFMPRGSEEPAKDLPEAIERAKAALKPGNMPKRVTASTPKKFTTLEVAPDPKDKAATAAWNKFDEPSKRRVTEKVGNDLLPKLAKDMKLPKPKLTHVIGGFMQETNPSIIVEFPDSVPYEKQQEFAKVAGHLLKQNSVITFDETNKTDDQTFFVGVVPSRKLTYDETSSLYKQINTGMPEAGGFTGKEDKLIFGNFSDLSNEEFYAKLKPVLDAAEKSVDYELTATEHTFRSNYIETDTPEKALTDTYYGKLQESGTGGDTVRGGKGNLDSLRTFATKSVRGAITEENKRIKRYADTPDAEGLQKLIDDAKARALVNIAGITSEPLLVRSNYEQLASGKIKYKDVVEKSITDQPLVVQPMPNLAVAKTSASLSNKNVGTYKPGQYQKNLGDRINQGAARIAADPQILADPTGYVEYMRDMGVTGDILTPPSALKMLLETPEKTLALLQGGYHEDKTVPGTKEAAIQGLDGVMDMRNILAGKGPTPLVTALHHFWGTLSKQLPPIQQEALWMRLISNPEVMEQIQKSLDGTFDLTKAQWNKVVQRARSSNQGNYGKFGNNATANANSFHLMLKNHNGKWGQVADVYSHNDSVDMRNAFWGLGHGATGIKNKVQSFIGLTFGIPSNILDRWRFVSLNLPMLMEMHGSKTPREYFTYSGRNKTVPEDRLGVYKNYGTVENGNVPLSIALYSGLDRAVQAGIDNYAPLKTYLGAHANPGGFHWIDWNAIKNEAVGHSSLDITKTFLQQYGRNGDASDFLKHIGKSTVFTEGENKGKMVRLTMKNGVFSLE